MSYERGNDFETECYDNPQLALAKCLLAVLEAKEKE